MISRPQTSATTPSLNDLRREQPADATVRNLLGVLDSKLELCSRLPVFAWEAAHEGHAESAQAFRELAEMERRSCDAVIDCLRAHLDQRPDLAAEGAA